MESLQVTTPFGRRPMALGMLASQVEARDIEPNKSVDKWRLFRMLCEAKPLLGVTDRALAVLNALLSFYPKGELSEENGLVVFPSNAQLSLRTHGMAEATLRRHLAALVDAGLLIRKDSPNGKRYARKDRAGAIDEAFGFSLACLLARADEIEQLAATVINERLRLQRLRERLTLYRRDVAKLIDTALEERAPGNWLAFHERFRKLVCSVPRTPGADDVAYALEGLEDLRDEIGNILELHLKTKNMNGNPDHIERHIQNSDSDSNTESEPGFETKQEAGPENLPLPSKVPQVKPHGDLPDRQNPALRQSSVPAAPHPNLKPFPLGLVLQACPEIMMYGPSGKINGWRDLMAAAVVVRSMLGISPSAYQEACEIMGPENAATVIACIFERAGHINSAGGYLRDLTRRAWRGEFAIGPMLMALARANSAPGRQTG